MGTDVSRSSGDQHKHLRSRTIDAHYSAPQGIRLLTKESGERGRRNDGLSGNRRERRLVDPAKEVSEMGSLLIVTFLVVIGPLSYFFGVDSRRSTDRGWFGVRRK
jgi:hypothetical protein